MRNNKAIKLTMIAVLAAIVLSMMFVAAFGGTVEVAKAAGEVQVEIGVVGDSTVVPGGKITLEVTISSSVEGTWSSIEFAIQPLKADGTLDTSMLSYFAAEKSDIVLSFSDGTDASSYLNNSTYVSTTTNPKAGISLKASDNGGHAPSGPSGAKAKFTISLTVNSGAAFGDVKFGLMSSSVSASAQQFVTIKTPDGKSNRKTIKAGDMVGNSTTVTVGAASSENTLSALEVGHGGSLSAISAPGGVLPTTIDYVSTSQSLSNFRIKPTAKDSKATIRVGKGTNATAIAQNGTVVASGATSGDIALDAITTPGGSATVTIVVTPQNNSAPAIYTINIKSNYINLAELSGTSNTGTSGVTKNGISNNEISIPDDATSVTINGRFAGGYGVQSTVNYEVSGATGGSTTLGSNGNFSFTVNNVQNGQTVTIKATAGAGAEFTRALTVKKYSVNADLNSIQLNSNGQAITHDESQSEPNNNRYVFMLPTGVSQATMNLVKGNANATIKVGNENYDTTKAYGNGAYTVTVTAEAGNVKTYQVIIINRVASAELTKLEMSFDRANWIDVLTAPEYNSTTATYTKDYATSSVSVGSSVYFRYEATSGATVTPGTSVSVQDDLYVGQLAIGTNEYRFTASSSAGNMIYVLRLGLREGINSISGVTITDQDGAAISGFQFNSATTTYTLNVPYGTSSVRLGVMIDGVYATVRTARDGQMERDEANVRLFVTNRGLNVGSNTITFYAVADNGTGAEGTRYTITVTRAAADTNNLLSSLRVLIGGVEKELSPAFNPNVDRYTIIDSSDVNTVTIEAVAQSAVAKLRGVGEIPLSTAVSGSDNIRVLTVVVTAENGVEKTYYINISKAAIDFDKNYDIGNIAVMGSDGKSYINYVSATREYTVSVPYDVSGVFINVSTVATTASVHLLIGDGEVPGNATARQDLQVGANKFVVYAVAANNANSDRAVQYTIVITREEANSNSFLSSIIINNVPIANFDKNVVEYVSNQDSTVSFINMVVYAEEQNANVAISANGEIKGSGMYTTNATIELGEQGRTVTVTIAVTIDGSTKFYTVRVVRATSLPVLNFLSIGSHNFWSNADMKEGEELDMTNSNTFLDVIRFFTTVEYAEETLTIIAETGSAANVRINGRAINENVERGVQFVSAELFGSSMKVTVRIDIIPIGSGTVNTYTIEIVRNPAPSSSTDTDTLKITGVNEFNNEYLTNPSGNVFGSYIVEYSMTTLPFEIAFPNLGDHVAPATYEIYYNAMLKNRNGEDNPNVKLNFGTNIVSVTINASDGITKRTISIIVVRDDFEFKTAEIDEIAAFRRDYSALKNSYSYSVGHNVSKLTFRLEAESGYRYEIVNNELRDGVNTVYVRVYEEDGEARSSEVLKEIAINVYREGKNSTTAWMVVGILFLVLFIVVMAILILFILKTSKNGGDGGSQQMMQPVIIQANPDAEVNNIGGDEKAVKKALREQKKRDREELKAARAEEKARIKAEERAAREAAAAEAAAAKAAAEAEAQAKAKEAEAVKPAESGAQNNEFIVSAGSGNNSKKVKIRLNISGIEGTDVTNMSVEETTPDKPDKK